MGKKNSQFSIFLEITFIYLACYGMWWLIYENTRIENADHTRCPSWEEYSTEKGIYIDIQSQTKENIITIKIFLMKNLKFNICYQCPLTIVFSLSRFYVWADMRKHSLHVKKYWKVLIFWGKCRNDKKVIAASYLCYKFSVLGFWWRFFLLGLF